MNDISPRPATDDDLMQVTQIESMSNLPPWSQEAFAAELVKKTSHFWVLTDNETDEKIFAYIVCSFVGEQAHIQTLGVGRAFRRRGYATLLLRFLINFILRKGGDSIYLEVRKSNTAAIALYQQLGFVILKTVKGIYPDGEEGFAMLFRFQSERLTSKDDEQSEDTGASLEEIDSGSKKNIN
jgi:[ribosomal protein S18]-alanine N-acetyltransferase